MPDPPWSQPLAVTCRLEGQVVLTGGGLMLDALLMAAVAIRDRLPPVARGQSPPPLAIPLAPSACGRVWLASEARPAWDAHETRYRNRRFPAREALRLTAMRRVDTGAGAQKSYRIPYAAGHVAGDALRWWCLGEPVALAALLALVHRVGRHRGVGYGRVVGWDVAPCAPWGAGFPVLRDGAPTRPLPLDWPGLGTHAPAYRVLAPPYWDEARAEPCAVAP